MGTHPMSEAMEEWREVDLGEASKSVKKSLKCYSEENKIPRIKLNLTRIGSVEERFPPLRQVGEVQPGSADRVRQARRVDDAPEAAAAAAAAGLGRVQLQRGPRVAPGQRGRGAADAELEMPTFGFFHAAIEKCE